jgi:hypothetical protein
MKSFLALAAVLLVAVAPAAAGGVSGQYVEARTCDVWTGACFANAEMNLAGKHAVLAWHIEQGTHAGVRLDGLSVIAVVEARDTLGLEQTGPAKAVVLVDTKANAAQREALVALVKKLGGKLTQNIIAVETAPIQIAVGHCKEAGCARVEAGRVRVETRCIHPDEDKACGHEDNFYPPLTAGVTVRSAMVTENSYTGAGLNTTWNDAHRRGAYIGSFCLSD